MRYGYVSLLAAALLVAAVAVAAGPAPEAKTTTGVDVSGGYGAQVTDYGLATQTINPGGVITGYAIIRNNGNDVINDALIHIAILQPRNNAHSIKVTDRDQTFNDLNIPPGGQKRIEFSMNAPGSIAAGSYTVQATVEAGGYQIETFTQKVTVT